MSTTTTTARPPQLDEHGGHREQSLLKLSLGAMGVVYGDIGTSPLYAVKESLHAIHGGDVTTAAPPHHLLGVASLALWSIVIVVVFKYLLVVMRADNRGEGGILAMLALLLGQDGGEVAGRPTSEPRRSRRPLTMWLGLFAAALLLSDGVITPAISVLSAVEGLEIAAPGLDHFVVPITVAVLFGLFWVQKYGTARIGRMYGPIMLVWFLSIGLIGLAAVVQHPSVLAAVSPWYFIRLAIEDPVHTFILLSSIVLVITGAEALYADMGHFGRRPIRMAWFYLVFPALILNYFGQTATVMASAQAGANPFWSTVPSVLRYPMVVVATLATIIASQAMISGAFSLSRQAMQLGYSPRLRVVHTSAAMMGQIFVPTVNTLMMFMYIGLVVVYQDSSKLAAMYGLAVTGTFVVTSMLLFMVARERWQWSLPKTVAIVGFFLLVDCTFLASTLSKFDDGGWVTLLIASVIFAGMMIWYVGRVQIAKTLGMAFPLTSLFGGMKVAPPHRVKGTAIFMSTRPGMVPAVLLHHLRHNQVLHERIILLSVRTLSVPFVSPEHRFKHSAAGEGFEELTINFGFVEEPDVPRMLRHIRDTTDLNIDVDGASYYLGHVTLRITPQGRMPRLLKTIFGFMYHNERPAHEFFNLPVNRVIELGRQAEL